MSLPAVRYENFGFQYSGASTWAIRDISLEIQEGEILLVLGRSGCGKSTLALALNGAVPHLLEGNVEGSLLVAGLPTLSHRVSDMAVHVGMVFQDPEVQLFALTVEDEVAMSLESYGIPRDEMRERVEWAMSVCGVSGMELKAPSKLSGGQKQRVAIAAVLAREPEILVFDEPTGNLDPVGSRSVYETIRRICDDRGRTIVLVEQDLAPVIDLVDRVIVLEEGHLVFEGTPHEVLREMNLLRRSGVKIPAATEFGLRLERRGLVSYPQTPATLDEALQPASGLFSLNGTRPHHSRASLPSHRSQESQSKPIIEFQNVVHEFRTGHRGIDSVDLAIYPGEFVAICGMNGAGKTTTALHVMGLLKPTGGAVLVDGHDTKNRTVAEMARTVGLIFQNPNHQLFKDTVAAEIAFGPRNLGWDEGRIAEATTRVLDLVGLPGMKERDPESLSIGQKQRVAIAAVLVMEPRILILDEPTTGQDQQTLEPFMRLVAELNNLGMTVLMITHDMDVAMRYSSRIVVMNRGQIIADDEPGQIFLQEDVLTEASLHLPEILALTRHLTGTTPVYVTTFDEMDEWLGLPTVVQEDQHDISHT
jgi:energy-coupling factor transport system ATP-binding protein